MRGHAKGPFNTAAGDTNPALRVQKFFILSPGDSKTLNVEASETDPVLLRFNTNVQTALATGSNLLKVGNSSDDDAYIGSGDVTLGSTGFATEKKYVIRADTALTIALTSTSIAASKALTISAITGANTQTVVIGGQTYTFNTSLTNTANNVLIGADATAMGNNLAAAINAGAGAGTTYGTGTVANASVTATADTGVVTVTAKTSGSGGNAVTISETLTNGAWAGGATTLSGGSTADTAGVVELFIDA